MSQRRLWAIVALIVGGWMVGVALGLSGLWVGLVNGWFDDE